MLCENMFGKTCQWGEGMGKRDTAQAASDNAANGVKVRRRKITDYQPDPNNPNKGSDRGRAIIRESLEKRGAGRSLLASADDVFIAGNQTMQEALETGITDVIEVETDGTAMGSVRYRVRLR